MPLTVVRASMVALAFLVFSGIGFAQSPSAPATPDADARWRADLAAFEAADHDHPQPPGGVLFVGSSSIRLWNGLEQQFGHVPVVIKRGLGGSRIDDFTRHLSRLVLRYRPRLVVVYAGDNDIAQGRSPKEVLASFQTFATRLRQSLQATRIAFISIKPSPTRREFLPKVRQANALIEDWAGSRPWLDFIDVYTPMTLADGAPRPELFRADGLHLNDAGYALWRSIIADRLR
ncbi:MAG: SGNH/GDSL hydrolase family protein [Burkholderiales bacterium]